MTYRLKRCGMWKSFSHILMSCSRGFYVTGSGFVIRRIPAVVKQLAYRWQCEAAKHFGDYPASKKAPFFGPSCYCHGLFWFVGHDHSVNYRVKPVSHAHLLSIH
ncbi:hypothetical protein [Aquitalea magnusonii]|uniref:Uncharacterized protein n=1 Tax=Aquitalea magnusonii TaxID=332411 RepID=A0A318JZL4_9NEIS|nr:hypothetical protein [Aquitalea magnusonii]PXX51204.1 hypothetical protein DFR38_101266 [Aquitalea magnusonii]